MKKIKMTLLSILFLSVSTFAQTTVFDLTTGVGGVGTVDPNWSVNIQGWGPGYIDAYISTGNNQSSGGTVYTSFAQDPCGTYISHFLTAANHVASNAPTDTFTYRYTFNLNNCPVVSANINVGFIAADNELHSMSINGNPITVPAGVTFNTPGSFSQLIPPGQLIPGGTNTILVKTYNAGLYEALQLCGRLRVDQQCCNEELQIETCDNPCANPDILSPIWITDGFGQTLTEPNYSFSWSNGSTSSVPVISAGDLPITVTVTNNATGCTYTLTYDCPKDCDIDAPVELYCEIDADGNVTLNWNAVPGAVDYIIEVNWDDPTYCNTGTPPTGMLYNSPVNSVSIPLNSTCFSWRVRAKCEDGTLGPWSDYTFCSFDKGKMANSGSDEATSKDLDFSIVPNPFDANVELQIPAAPQDGQMNIEVTDATGKVVYTDQTESRSSIIINTESWSTGMYMCKVEISGEVIIHKMIKQ